MKQYVPAIMTFAVLLTVSFSSCAQPLHHGEKITSQDSLRGSLTPERLWWDVTSYNIQVAPDFESKTILGWNQIGFDVTRDVSGVKMQLDLQQPMQIDSVIFDGKQVKKITRNGNVYYLDFGNYRFETSKNRLKKTNLVQLYNIKVFFSGKPREAVNPPWDGGWIFTRDQQKRPWMTVACQGLGASVWYPCKDHQSDEPQQGALIQVKVPKPMVAVANGKLYSKDDQGDGNVLYTWQVINPINNYNIVPYIGSYVNFSDSFKGIQGKDLSLNYWVLDYNLEKAKKQFGRDVKPMLTCFEYWFGPYPFYEDGFKLVESSHLGMEHQSAIAYGNHYMDGYLGMDLSGSGWGKKWDYIIIHEAGHEWFGNNITTNDIADMWVHEGFTMYSEVLFVECQYGRKAADEYCQGIRNNISNQVPLIGPYGVNKEGSGDMYNKGANLIHTVRSVISDDSLFRNILRGLNADFYHKTVNSSDVEQYFSKKSGKDLSKIFDQYLRTIMIPRLEYRVKGDNLEYRWANVVDGFKMPLQLADPGNTWLYPTTSWQTTAMTSSLMDAGIKANPNFYVKVEKLQ
jgi:aminopeptidase N